MLNRGFKIMVLSPPGVPDPSLAIAASRARELGVLDLQYSRDRRVTEEAIRRLAEYSNHGFGIKVGSHNLLWLFELPVNALKGLQSVIMTFSDSTELKETVRKLQARGIVVILECTCLAQAKAGEEIGVDGIIAKGHEAGGRIGNETTFVLLQQFKRLVSLPVWAQGGIGLHTAASCYTGGAAGVVLDTQLLLTRESPLSETIKAQISRMDGSETVCLGQSLGETYRVASNLGSSAVEQLKGDEQSLAAAGLSRQEMIKIWRQNISGFVDCDSPTHRIFLIGQDVAFAAPLADRYITVAGVIQGLKDAIDSHCESARRLRLLGEGSPLANSHGTRYPIVQGPLARISDHPLFVRRAAENGGLPFLAVAWTHGQDLDSMLQQTQDQLENYPWGVGLLGFLPGRIYNEQLQSVLACRPAFALIAGGRPDQCAMLEQEGIATYVHVPSPGVLQMFIDNGMRRFVLEGRESGGHVGPCCSFALWDQLIDVLFSKLATYRSPDEYHILLAGGIHDSISAAMAVVAAAPLAETGCRIGVQMGSAYLFTREAVESGAIVEDYQQAVIDCKETILLESGGGHASRCVETPFVRDFLRERSRLVSAGKSPEETREFLDKMTAGGLRIATRGILRNPEAGRGTGARKNLALEKAKRWSQGMYMVGQLAALRNSVTTISELHHEVSAGGEEVLKKYRQTPLPTRTAKPKERPSNIAIIGMACVLPKAPSLIEYWDNILHRVDAIQEVPPERWDWRNYYSASRQERDKVYSKWGAFIDPIRFDPLKYGMPPNSIRSIEPLQLLALETAVKGLENAGYTRRPFARERTAVILGISGTPELGQLYGFRSSLPMFLGDSSRTIIDRFQGVLPEWTEDSFSGILTNVTAGRIANRLDLGGPNFTVDGACASSLAAIYLAVRELETGSSDLAIVGGADTMQNPFTFLCFSNTQALSPRGKSCPLDASADGIVIGEGIGVVVLKRLVDAERDGDRIYAVIKGVGAASDGRGKSLTAPRLQGQVLTLERAYAKAGVAPTTIGLVEAHSTGTTLGDQTEVEALMQLLKRYDAPAQNCAIGSVKSMIGHTKSTAGTASLIKAAMALHHKVLPPTLNVSNPIGPMASPASPLYVNTETRPWFNGADDSPRRAGVSAFGFGGTNFHVVVEEYTQDYMATASDAAFQRWPVELFIWQSNSTQNLIAALRALEETLRPNATVPLRNLAYTINRSYADKSSGDAWKPLNLAIVALSLEDLKQKLRQVLEKINRSNLEIENPAGIYFRERTSEPRDKIAFLFPGQGSQYLNMLADLAIQFYEVRETFERSDRFLKDRLAKPLSAYVFPPPTQNEEQQRIYVAELGQTNIAQPAMGTADLAVLRLLREFGISPDIVAGHSYGEYVALCAAGVLQEGDLMRLSEARGRFIVESVATEPGIMAAINANHQVVSETIRNLDGAVIANVNGPEQTVISGTKSSVDQTLKHLESIGIKAWKISVSCAFHSPIVAPARNRLKQFLAGIELSPPLLPVYSNFDARPYPAVPDAIARQLVDHLVSKVEFVDEIENIYESGVRIFIECGPGRVLSSLVDRILVGRPHMTTSADFPARSGLVQLNHLLGQLVVQGVPVKIDRVYRGRSVTQVDLKQLAQVDTGDDLPSGIWLVDGARAVPIKEASPGRSDQRIRTLKISVAEGTATDNSNGSKPQNTFTESASIDPAPTESVSSPKPDAGFLHRSFPSSVSPASSEEAKAQVMMQFQRMMAKFLDTQKRVMQSYLRAGVDSAQLPVDLVENPRSAPANIPDVPGEKSWMSIQREGAPTGDLTRTKEEESPEPVGQQHTPGSASKTAAGDTPDGMTKEVLASELLRIVSERTGYPQEMLSLDQELEADLGIDSIKRIEILGSFTECLPPARKQAIEKETEQLASQKTMRGIIRWVIERIPAASQDNRLPTGIEPSQTDPKVDAEPLIEQNQAVERFTLTREVLPRCSPAAVLPVKGMLAITDDERGVAGKLAKELAGLGREVVLIRLGDHIGQTAPEIYETAFKSSEEVSQLLSLIRTHHGPLGGLIHLLPLRDREMPADMHLAEWKQLLRVQIKSLFYLVKGLELDLREAAAAGGACIFGATAMGNHFVSADRPRGPGFFPGHGGIAGLLKSLALEWPTVNIKAVNFGNQESETEMVQSLLAELASMDRIAEVGYENAQRIRLKPKRAPLSERTSSSYLMLDSSSVILVTGGARGITAGVARELARKYRARFILVGRSPLPAGAESPETADILSPAELKSVIISKMRSEGVNFSLGQVEAAYNRLLKEREIRKNLALLHETGARVDYFQADVCDEKSFSELIDKIYATYGGIDGVIHGAGIIEDKLLKDKSDSSFDRVFDTKVDSGFILAQKLRPDSLKFLAFFTSVAGRFGNKGQADYAAANEVLNKLAVRLDNRWPARIVSVNWGPWASTGMVNPELQRQFAEKGVELVPPEIGVQRFDQEITYGRKGEVEIILGGNRMGS